MNQVITLMKDIQEEFHSLILKICKTNHLMLPANLQDKVIHL